MPFFSHLRDNLKSYIALREIIFIPPTVPQSTSIIRGRYERPTYQARSVSPDPKKLKRNNKSFCDMKLVMFFAFFWSLLQVPHKAIITVKIMMNFLYRFQARNRRTHNPSMEKYPWRDQRMSLDTYRVLRCVPASWDWHLACMWVTYEFHKFLSLWLEQRSWEIVVGLYKK
jgi:hypothetical protein